MLSTRRIGSAWVMFWEDAEGVQGNSRGQSEATPLDHHAKIATTLKGSHNIARIV
jgi:hypothetical protein